VTPAAYPFRAGATTANDLMRAVSLYERNTELSAAFWIVLCDLEVLVRNAMHEKLTDWSIYRYGRPGWYLDRGEVFNEQTINDIESARHHLAITSPSITVPSGCCTSRH
jgi:hypothetical protein